jgi:hypothetical protein
MKNMTKTQILIIEFLISFSIYVFGNMQAKALTYTYAASMSLASAKGLTSEVKEWSMGQPRF